MGWVNISDLRRSGYGLCGFFLAGNEHVLIGTKACSWGKEICRSKRKKTNKPQVLYGFVIYFVIQFVHFCQKVFKKVSLFDPQRHVEIGRSIALSCPSEWLWRKRLSEASLGGRIWLLYFVVNLQGFGGDPKTSLYRSIWVNPHKQSDQNHQSN